jgi:cytochrome b561
MSTRVQHRPARYAPLARALHWSMALLIALQAVMGFVMVHEAPEPNVWATLTNALDLYSVHKSVGVILLMLLILRLVNRLVQAAPPPEADLGALQREASTLVHAWMYLLLLVVPLLGWIGISLYPALVVFDAATLPALASPNRPVSETVFAAHRIAAIFLLALICVHIAAALYHHFIRRDGVLGRMWPWMSRSS